MGWEKVTQGILEPGDLIEVGFMIGLGPVTAGATR